MKIGILVLFVNSFGKRGLYNSQEIGLAKAFADKGHQVTVYKCVDCNAERVNEVIYPNVTYICNPVKTIGNNAISNFNWMDGNIDLLVCFSDIQLFVKRAYRWAQRSHAVFAPYVGTIESHSENGAIRFLSNINAKRIQRFYRAGTVFVKTHALQKQMQGAGIKGAIVAPVGLDITKLRSDCGSVSQAEAREALRLKQGARYLLMVGRLAAGRSPFDCVEVFARVRLRAPEYRLLVVGKGELKDELFAKLAERGLSAYTDYIESLPNEQMWKAYRSADALISFCRNEIFGMSILEAMYFEKTVYVMRAPGPNDIVEDGISGFLFDSLPEMAEGILREKDEREIGERAHARIMNQFQWSKTADIFLKECG